jgi:hypothetical protein
MNGLGAITFGLETQVKVRYGAVASKGSSWPQSAPANEIALIRKRLSRAPL